MRPSRRALFTVSLTSLFCLFPLTPLAHETPEPHASSSSSRIIAYHGILPSETRAAARSAKDEGGGIKEIIPEKYAPRYQQWKQEFLSTETGRRQWALFESNPRLTLTIKITRDNPRGAGTGQYKWDDAGKLVEATIVLGSSINEGYPNPIYYPVMNSLMPQETSYADSRVTLAAAKIAHEFGHLTRTADMDHSVYELQNQLMPVYNKILLSNGRNINDPKLIELAQRMGGTPVEIWEDREYWGETNAMLFLRDRFAEADMRCALFGRIRHSVDLYAKNYTERFLKVAQSSPSLNRCGWQ